MLTGHLYCRIGFGCSVNPDRFIFGYSITITATGVITDSRNHRFGWWGNILLYIRHCDSHCLASRVQPIVGLYFNDVVVIGIAIPWCFKVRSVFEGDDSPTDIEE